MCPGWRGKPAFSFLAAKEEDRFSEFLGQLLLDPGVLRAFLALCQIEYASPETLSVRTQVTTSTGRPDLAIRKDPDLYLLVEAKVGSWLHEGQLEQYAAALTDWKAKHGDGAVHLVMLCPALERKQGERDLATVASSPIGTGFVSWEDVASLCDRQAQMSADPHLRHSLEEFSSIIRHRLGARSRAFTAEEERLLSDGTVAMALDLARQLVDRTRDVLSERGLSTTASAGSDYQGYWIEENGRRWWFGLWYGIWAQTQSAIVLQFNGWKQGPLPEFEADLPECLVVEEGGRTVCVMRLAVLAGVQPDDLARTHADQIIAAIRERPALGTQKAGPD